MGPAASFLARYRHAQLLGALTLLLLVDPFLSGLVGPAILDLFLALALVSAIVACSEHVRHVVIGVSMATLMLAATVFRRVEGIEVADVALGTLAIFFFGYVIALVLGSVFRESRSVSIDTICGGLSVYLLMGLLWAFAFALLESAVPGSFSGIENVAGSYKRFLGFSFVTLTTLGYGNIVPMTPRADALAVAEAVVGQIYLTVLVARLVGLNLVHSAGRSES
jgi:voltage-gated potassium channel